MAENKNSFVFYTDWEDTFRALPKEKGYDLLIHMLDYVNDRNPETDDILINAVFQQLKNTLKRDLKGYETRKEERSHSGRIGNLKRYNPDLYKKLSDGKITLENAEKVAISRKASLSDKSVAKLAVNDSVNVSVSDSDILLKKVTKHDDEAPEIFSDEIDNAKNFLKTEKKIQMDRLRMKHNLSPENLHDKIDEFIDKKSDWGETGWKDNYEMAKNFELWLNTNNKVISNPFKKMTDKEFHSDIGKFEKEFGKKMLTDFYRYWNQPTETGEMRFQEKNAWDTENQLKIWRSRNGK